MVLVCRLLAGCALAVCGCASSLTTLEPAKTVGPGKFELVAGMSVPVHTVFVSSMAKTIADGADRLGRADSTPITPSERADLERAAMAAVLFQPAAVPEFKGRVGIIDRLDVGLRYAGPALKADFKVNFFRSDTVDLAVSAGYAHHTSAASWVAKGLFGLFGDLRMTQYSRRDLDVALLASGGGQKRIFPYGALRWVMGMPEFQTSVPAELLADRNTAVLTVNTPMHYVGATGGIRAGGEKIALLAELTAMYVAFSPTVMGERRDLSGLVLVPAAAVDFRF